MAKESQSVENAVIVAIAVLTAAIVSQWMYIGFYRIGETIYIRYLGTAFFLILSLGVALHIKNYPLKIGRYLGLTAVLWVIIYLFMFKIPSEGMVLIWVTWGLSATFYVVSIRLILKVNFPSTVWWPWLICTLALLFGIGDFNIATFVWIFGLAIVPVFAEVCEDEVEENPDVE